LRSQIAISSLQTLFHRDEAENQRGLNGRQFLNQDVNVVVGEKWLL
jgi:hypothetical protein